MIAAPSVPFPAWHAHTDAWVLMGLLEFVYLCAVYRRARRTGPEAGAKKPTSGLQVAAFTAGVLILLVASDWPVHDVAEGYLYSVHMLQHMLFTLAAASLLLLGTPTWMARHLLSPRWLLVTVRFLSRPLIGLIQFNLILVLSHWPLVVEATVEHHPLHFVAHAVLLVSAVLMWMPVLSPLPEIPRIKPLAQMLYLFLQTVVPTIPASFLTFGKKPLYHVYETFPRLWGISALDDQLTAGLIMKIGGGLFFWTVIAIIFFRWYSAEESKEARERAEVDEDVLLWEDVERELKQLDRPS
ncbi:MAG TPA: cytochrome c oxidase assembly protein [Acidimicrobiales bacterium]|nr:cytochrome c oxidase assembly protein [Acidimicrobiales bacterium]